jgi:hypothetical protein
MNYYFQSDGERQWAVEKFRGEQAAEGQTARLTL